ncbi:MAG: PAS domain S-box protein, partial [Smithellaceae bacterium]|nr:PAS domain S-box protein [Smithellaceae bacterium]
YKTILESIEEAYLEVDLAGNLTFFNRAALQMLGYTADELMSMNYRRYVSPDATRRIYRIFNAIYRTGKSAEIFDYQIIKKDGSRMFREMSASLIRDLSGSPVGFRCVARDVTKRKLADEALKKKDRELEIKSRSLAESNTALKVLLKQREEDKMELERNILTNVRQTIIPHIEELKKCRLAPDQLNCVNAVESNLKNIISPFLRNLTLNHFNLTPKEFQVADLIREGKTTKEIAGLLNISTGAIDFHRNSIRKKLGMNNRKVNLRSFLTTLS